MSAPDAGSQFRTQDLSQSVAVRWNAGISGPEQDRITGSEGQSNGGRLYPGSACDGIKSGFFSFYYPLFTLFSQSVDLGQVMLLRLILICIRMLSMFSSLTNKGPLVMRVTDKFRWVVYAGLLLGTLAVPTTQAADSDTDLATKLESLQRQIDELKSQLAQTQNQTVETDAKIEAVAEVIDSQPFGQAASQRTTIGGYGELHYNSLDADDPSRDVDEVDFHRFVLFFGHQFNDNIRFYSEFELEHSLVADSGGSTPGEVELEQAFIEYDLSAGLHSKAGLFLLPVGILNETHEPPTFFGVERNDVENIIVPSTWWEAGAALNGRWGSDWAWDLALSSGLQMPTTGSSAFRVRSGRQKVAKALASDGAVTGRLRYMGIPGLQAALTVQHQFDPSQAANDGLDDGTLIEAHVDYRHHAFGLRALYAHWDFSGEAVEAAQADSQTGWYIEPSYRFNERLGFYTRFEDLEGARGQDKFDQWEFGLNWWLSKNVVVKFDYRNRTHDLASQSGRDFTGIDLGLGYNF